MLYTTSNDREKHKPTKLWNVGHHFLKQGFYISYMENKIELRL